MIKEIKWNSHAILGDLTLDFTKADGSIYNTIVLAGENGTGKTTILETLAMFLNLGSIEAFDYIKYAIENTTYEVTGKNAPNPELGFHIRKNESTGTTKRILTGKSSRREELNADIEDIRHYGVAYSKARSGFNTKRITSTTTQQLDSTKYEMDTSDDFTPIKQLLVDISEQDNEEWMRITKTGAGTSFEEFQKESRLFRFEGAFNQFFDTVKFKNIVTENSKEKSILFEKNGKNISIDNLSTGEKQIVFRGSYLLKNMNGITGGVVLVDEPELSMHPKWQGKILQFYRNLFTKDDNQSVQMILATHSEYVLKAALEESEDVLLIVLNEYHGAINSKRITTSFVLPAITSAEINYLAFGILSVDYHIELYGYLQLKTGLGSVIDCDRYILAQTGQYDPTIHEKHDNTLVNGHVPGYQTLPTYIRNAIDHPDSGRIYTQEELKTSIELLIELCR